MTIFARSRYDTTALLQNTVYQIIGQNGRGIQ